MNVGELIKELQKLPLETVVLVRGENWPPVHLESCPKIYRLTHNDVHFGSPGGNGPPVKMGQKTIIFAGK